MWGERRAKRGVAEHRPASAKRRDAIDRRHGRVEASTRARDAPSLSKRRYLRGIFGAPTGARERALTVVNQAASSVVRANCAPLCS